MTLSEGSGAQFTEEERQVAEMLLWFPKLVLESDHRPVTGFPCWGKRRKRSVNPFTSSLSPSPNRGGKPNEGEEKKGEERFSPSTPLSFSPSGGDETPLPPPLPLPPRPAKKKSFENTERHKEWVKEQNQRISSLSATKVNLERFVAEAKARYQRLKERNSWLKEMMLSKLGQEVEDMPRRQQQQQQHQQPSYVNMGLDPFPVEPTHAVGHQQQYGVILPDLNKSAEEDAIERQRQEYRAAVSAQARKRRIEIQRVKSFMVYHKMPRLR